MRAKARLGTWDFLASSIVFNLTTNLTPFPRFSYRVSQTRFRRNFPFRFKIFKISSEGGNDGHVVSGARARILAFRA